MVIQQGEIWWAILPAPRESEPGYRRPVVIVQDNPFNQSRINTIICAVITSNLRLANAPGNVFLPADDTGLSKDSVANVSQLITLDRIFLTERANMLPERLLEKILDGVLLVLGR